MTTLEMPQDVDHVSNYMDQPGRYHCVIQDIGDPTDKNGNLLDWAEVKLTVSVLAGTVQSEVGKAGQFLFRKPMMNHKDGGAFFSRCLARLARAADILPSAKPGEQITIDWSKAKGKQVVIFTSNEEYEGKTRLNIDGLNVYRVTDEEVKGIPKCEKSLKLVQSSATSNKPASTQQPQSQNEASAPAESEARPAGVANFDDI